MHACRSPASRSDTDIELRLLMEAIYLKYSYDFRDYSGASLKRRVLHALLQLGCATISAAAGARAARPGGVQQLLQYPDDPGQRDVPRPGLLPGAAPAGGAACCTPIRRSRSGWPAAAPARRCSRWRSCCARRACSNARSIYATDINPAVAGQGAPGHLPARARCASYTANYQQAGGKRAFSDYYTRGLRRGALRPDLCATSPSPTTAWPPTACSPRRT